MGLPHMLHYQLHYARHETPHMRFLVVACFYGDLTLQEFDSWVGLGVSKHYTSIIWEGSYQKGENIFVNMTVHRECVHIYIINHSTIGELWQSKYKVTVLSQASTHERSQLKHQN